MIRSPKYPLYSSLLTMGVILAACSDSSSNNAEIDNDSSSQVTSTALVISEVVAKSDADGSDWIELQNSGDASISLRDYSLIDSNSESATVLPDVNLEPGAYLVIQATHEVPTDGSHYVPFKLGSDDSVILLLNNESVSELTWQDGDATSGHSYGFYKGVAQTLYPTPGAGNIPYKPFLTDQVVKVELNLSAADWQAILDDPLAEQYKPGSIVFNGITVNEVAIRVKGNSSLGNVANNPDSNRYSFKVDINYYNDDQKFMGLKKLIFNNGWGDPSLMREHLTYQTMREIGSPASRSAFVDLWMAGEHMGLYTFVEAVDSEFIEDHFDYEDGDLYKANKNSKLTWIDNALESYSTLELKRNEDTSDQSALINFLNQLNNSDDPGAVTDIDQVLRYLAVSTLLVNLDSYQGGLAHNYYLYEKERYFFTIIPWDLNQSCGGFNSACSYDIS